MKLTGLFEEKDSKFYTYYKDTESFGGLEDTDNESERSWYTLYKEKYIWYFIYTKYVLNKGGKNEFYN